MRGIPIRFLPPVPPLQGDKRLGVESAFVCNRNEYKAAIWIKVATRVSLESLRLDFRIFPDKCKKGNENHERTKFLHL